MLYINRCNLIIGNPDKAIEIHTIPHLHTHILTIYIRKRGGYPMRVTYIVSSDASPPKKKQCQNVLLFLPPPRGCFV